MQISRTLRLTGSQALDGTGNSLDNHLFGNAGSNRLVGSGGVDTLAGGASDDTYVGGSVLIEEADGGVDTVESSGSSTLGANFENLTLTGTPVIIPGFTFFSDFSGTGNDFANVIVGSAYRDVIDGKGSADTMSGGAGDDRYVVDTRATSSASWSAAARTSSKPRCRSRLVRECREADAHRHREHRCLRQRRRQRPLGNGRFKSARRWRRGGFNERRVGDDTYSFGRGDAADLIASLDTTSGKTDTLQLGAAIASSDIVVTRQTNDLLVSIRGTADSVRVRNHFLGKWQPDRPDPLCRRHQLERAGDRWPVVGAVAGVRDVGVACRAVCQWRLSRPRLALRRGR